MKLRQKFSQKRKKRRQKSLCKKVYKSYGTNAVLNYINQSAVFYVCGVKPSTFLWIAKQQLCGKQIKFYLLPNRLGVFFVVISREFYDKLFITILK